MVEEQTAADPSLQKKPATKRLCRFPGCQRVIKSQGHCQRHGAKTKRCKVEGCDKQAQGTHEGMCKRHWKEINVAKPVQEPEAPIEMAKPEGESVYDTILPQSISFRPAVQGQPVTDRIMPLVAFLRSNAKRCELGWHRQAERRARGLPPAGSLANQLEPWERQLVRNLLYICMEDLTLFPLGIGGNTVAKWRDAQGKFQRPSLCMGARQEFPSEPHKYCFPTTRGSGTKTAH